LLEELLAKWGAQPRGKTVSALFSEEDLALGFHRFQRVRARWERLTSSLTPGSSSKPRVTATACWDFPIYSQTFVYQELCQLAGNGFPVRFLYSKLNPREQLPPQFSALWDAKRRMTLHPYVCARDYQYCRERWPDRVAALLDLVCSHAGLKESEVRTHRHFEQAFTFTRHVEASRPDYLHSYFFYEGSFFTMVAAYLLDIPRGVSCYADHMLKDYELKLVPLHMRLCDVVIATSTRIRNELIAVSPGADASRILVKPNAINSIRFPTETRTEPSNGQPFRITCVSRVEPKKGIVYFVEAVRRLRDRGWNVEAHILGGVDRGESNQNYAAEVESAIRDHGLQNYFHLEGRRSEPEIRDFLRRSQLFVAPFIETDTGDKDGIPTALLEGMSTGLPAVVTDAGSIPEVVTDGVEGRIVAQRDAGALVEAIASLLGDPAQRAQMGQRAARTVRERFDVAVCEKSFHDRILRVCQSGR
jgi:colanic acid/amylovoran biosynthesis glycosyltransferase